MEGTAERRSLDSRIWTDPPLKAPTGFRTGNGVAIASAYRLELVWKPRIAGRKGAEAEVRRIAADNVRDAMTRFEIIQVRADNSLVDPVAEFGYNHGWNCLVR